MIYDTVSYKMILQILCLLIVNQLITINAATNRTFPEDFVFAVATAAYQIEGAWDEDGKGANIWDTASHASPSQIRNGDTGDVACDSYHKYKEDVTLLKELGVTRYRFSLSWSRILPTGFTNKINEAGVQYYINLLKELQAAEIEPLVTLYHWDLPQPLQDMGGWPNELVAEHYANYARICFERFGEYVKLWTTFNEPKQTCQEGYGTANKAPLISSPGVGEYLCTHTLLKAHARAYHIYDEEFRPTQNGRISIVIDSNWYEPASNSTEDIEAGERRMQFTYGWYANPIFIGNYPQVMIDRIAARSEAEGYPGSRLPAFTQEEIDYIKGTADFLGLNTYTTSLAQDYDYKIGDPSWDSDMGVRVYQDDSWEETASDWLRVVPWGIRKLLNWVSKKYNQPEIFITENGVSDNGTLNDETRINYYREYMSNVLLALLEDGVNVTGYTAWSLMDNFEWLAGYSEKFGLYQVDFDSDNRTRTPKASAEYYKKVISTRCLVDECEIDE